MQQGKSNHLPAWLQAVKSDGALSSPKVQAMAWADWVPSLFDPRQFVTLTSRNEVSLNAILRRHGFIVQQVNRKVFGNNWRRHGEGVSYVLGVEPQARGVLHVHAVWDLPFVDYRFVQSLGKQCGGTVYIEPVSSDCGVGYYVTKYAVKTGHVYTYLSRQVEALRFGSGDSERGKKRDASVASDHASAMLTHC